MKKFLLSATLTLTLLLTGIGASASGVLKVGTRDGEVSTVQRLLADQGYFHQQPTGYYGSVTKDAVAAFQKNNNLRVDGIVGSETRSALYRNASKAANRTYNDDDVYWLSRLVEAEAKGESYKGKLGVSSSVLNRVLSSAFPNNVVKVIFDTQYGVQYQPTVNGAIYNTPSADSVSAAIAALEGAKAAGNSMYFYNPKTSTNNWISKNRPYYTTIGNHDFHL